MESNRVVNEFLDLVQSVQWMSRCGSRLSIDWTPSLPVVQLSSWKACMAHILDEHTIHFMTAISNCLNEELSRMQPGGHWGRRRSREHSAWIDSLDSVLVPAAAKATNASPIDDPNRTNFYNIIHGHLRLSGIYLQYKDMASRSVIVDDIRRLLLSGHCVCGWTGENPEGGVQLTNGSLLVF